MMNQTKSKCHALERKSYGSEKTNDRSDVGPNKYKDCYHFLRLMCIDLSLRSIANDTV